MCDGIREPQDALSIAKRHANELLSKMDLSVDGAIAHASNIFVDDNGAIAHASNIFVDDTDEIPYTIFEILVGLT